MKGLAVARDPNVVLAQLAEAILATNQPQQNNKFNL